MSLTQYTETEFIAAVEKLSIHVNHKEIFSRESVTGGVGVTVPHDFRNKNCRQSYYKDCVFDSVQGSSVGFLGSKFHNVTFRNCDFEGGNLHSCDFKEVRFCGDSTYQYKMVNVGFHKSTFTDSIFSNLYIFSCGFTDVVFYNTIFRNCTIRLCSLENARFEHCQFINCDLSTLNLEFSEFVNIDAIATTFPFSTIPLAYGLLGQLPSWAKNNKVYSATAPNHSISIDEYLDLIKEFKCYYSHREKYYALANICIFQNRLEEGYQAIKAGLLNSIKTKDFRSVRHYCKLIYLNNVYSIHQRQALLENISSWVTHERLTISEYHSFQLFAGPIRELLINDDYCKPTIYFWLNTNIEANDLKNQVRLLSTIDQIMGYCNIPSNSIELRHNSAYVDFLTVVCNGFYQFSQVLLMLYGSLAGVKLFASGIKKISEATQSAVSGHDQHKIRKLEHEKMALEIRAMQREQEYKERMEDIAYQKAVAELKKLNLELESMEIESSRHNQILLSNGIIISARHSSKNLQSAPLHELMQYDQKQQS